MRNIYVLGAGILIGVLLQYSFTPNPELATTKAAIAKKRNGTVVNDDLKQRGQRLLSAIEDASHHSTQDHNYINDIVTRYIPIGTSFEDAEVILDYAGLNYKLLDRPPNTPFLVGWGCLSNSIISSTTIGINLYPLAPGDFHSNIGKISAAINSKDL